jgi:sortase A
VSAVRTTLRATGELLITAGVVVLLFCVYQLFWTNVTADAHAAQVLGRLEDQWAHSDPSTAASPDLPSAAVQPGDTFAIMYIPRLGSDWATAVVQGVTLDDLRGTVGHYPQSQMPGQIGNFAVAAHRATNGEPFRDLPTVHAGDRVFVETDDAWYVYTITSTEIVQPNAIDVILPVPKMPEVAPTRALITLTTCNPRWASYQRWITYGELTQARPKSDGPPPGLVAKDG